MLHNCITDPPKHNESVIIRRQWQEDAVASYSEENGWHGIGVISPVRLAVSENDVWFEIQELHGHSWRE